MNIKNERQKMMYEALGNAVEKPHHPKAADTVRTELSKNKENKDEDDFDDRTPEQIAMDKKNAILKAARLEKEKLIRETAKELGIDEEAASKLNLKMIDNKRKKSNPEEQDIESLFNLDDIPEEMRGIVKKRVDHLSQVIDIMEIKNNLTTDEILVALYRKHGIKMQRQKLGFMLRDLIKKGAVERVRNSVYTLAQDYRYKI